MVPRSPGTGRLEALRQEAEHLIWDLLDARVPIVAAVNGDAMGLGASIALLCDVNIVAEAAELADPHVEVGIVAGDGGTVVWRGRSDGRSPRDTC